jgi:hypothetical protein
MSRLTHRANVALTFLGVDTGRMQRVIRDMPRFVGEARAYARARRDDKFPLRFGSIHPILDERSQEAGTARGAYFHQDLWAARKIYEARPARHVDVGSRVDGFVAHVLVFMPVEVIDIRPLKSEVRGLTFTQADAMKLDQYETSSLPSLSSLHAVEHFGLGRYGDPIDPDGWRAAIAALQRILAPGGRLYFSVPIGRERVIFNAERVFSPRTILAAFRELRLVSFSAVDERGRLVEDADPARFEDCGDSCGLFELTK